MISLAGYKWIGTSLCLIGIALTSFNVYPANILFGFAGSLIWAIAGYAQDDDALLLVEAASTMFYATGMIAWLIA